MKKEQIQLCHKMICRYKSCRNEEKRNILRNEIFLIINPFMAKWIPAILSKKGMFLSHEEILSRSWDCFEFCLKHFKVKGPIQVPNHFYAYTKFYLIMKIIRVSNKEKRRRKNNIELEKLKTESMDIIYENLDELRYFRSMLEPGYNVVFDDALMSMHPKVIDKQRRMKESSLPQTRYKESKKIFKIVIDYLLRR